MKNTTRKSNLIKAFSLECRSKEIYDEVWVSFTDKEKENIQATLVSIFYTGQEQYQYFNGLYRSDMSALKPHDLMDIQCFHRTAMAFSRRKAKESDNKIEDVVVDNNDISSVFNSEPIAANTVSIPVETDKKRVSAKQKANTTTTTTPKPKDPIVLIEAAIEVIDREDIKDLLKKALTLMKVTQPTTEFTQFETSFDDIIAMFKSKIS